MKIIVSDSKNILTDNLFEYGFIKQDNYLIYEKNINNEFKVVVKYDYNELISMIIDLNIHEEYTVIDLNNNLGSYSVSIKEKYDNIINDIIKKCTINTLYKYEQTKEIMKYIENKYYDEIEYLWENTPKNGIYRHKDNRKWYAVILNVACNKIGLEGNNEIDIIDLKYRKDDILNVIDNKNILKGYHMNKKSWITIPLDGRVQSEEIY